MDEIADRSAEVTVSGPELLAKGFHEYRRYRLGVTIPRKGVVQQTRDVVAGGKVIAVLPVDIARQEVVLIRQFRLPAHLATGEGDMVEIVAGHIDHGEVPAAAAKRECEEEIGVAPRALVELFSYLTTPGLTDELVTVFVANIDASAVHENTATGGEHIRTLRVPFDDALDALARNRLHNGPAVIALQWLALNCGRLNELLGV